VRRETHAAASRTRCRWSTARTPPAPTPRIWPATKAPRRLSSCGAPREDCTSPGTDTGSSGRSGTPPASLRPSSSRTWAPPRWTGAGGGGGAAPPETSSPPHGYRPPRTSCTPRRSRFPGKPSRPPGVSTSPPHTHTHTHTHTKKRGVQVRAAPVRARGVMELSSGPWE